MITPLFLVLFFHRFVLTSSPSPPCRTEPLAGVGSLAGAPGRVGPRCSLDEDPAVYSLTPADEGLGGCRDLGPPWETLPCTCSRVFAGAAFCGRCAWSEGVSSPSR